MPTYTYRCANCNLLVDRVCKVADRNLLPECLGCGREMPMRIGAPLFRMAGVIPQGGGPDRFTADMLGMRLDELPAGLKS